MADTPHFAYPFRFDGPHAVEVEQDTVEEVETCVEVVLHTRPGERDDLPEFGVPDPTFGQRPLDLDAMASAVTVWEPRADLFVEARPDRFQESVERAQITVSLED